MKLAAADFLGFSDLASAWSSEPGSRSYDYILARLLEAYWSGAFEHLLKHMPDHWPLYMETFRILNFCGGLPLEAFPDEDGGEPNWDGLAGVTFDDYPPSGQAIMAAVELPRDMIRLWCLDQGYELPKFWFPNDEDIKPVGRPSIKHRVFSQMTLRNERGELKPTLAEEARALHEWAERNLGHTHQIPEPRSIENAIRELYWSLKK